MKKKLFRYLILLSCCVCLFFFIRATDFDMVLSSLNRVGIKFSLLLIVTFIAYFLGTLGWKYCFEKTAGAFSLSRLFFVRHIGETVSLINPANIAGGEAVKVFLLRDAFSKSNSVITSVVISRVIMIITQLSLFSSVAVYLLYSGVELPISAPWGAGIILIALTLVLAGIIILPKLRIKIPEKHGYIRKMALKIREIYTDLRLFYIHEKKKLGLAVLFFLLHWIFGAMEFYIILKFLGKEVTVWQAVLVDMGVIFFKSAGAFVPGQIGIEELGNKIMLGAVGIVGDDVWITASILRRARQFFWILFGAIAYIIVFKKWKRPEKMHGDIICKS